MVNDWNPSEPERIITTFANMLQAATGDGAAKRRAGEKVSWEVDTTHEAALFSHLSKWKHGDLVDDSSGAHPLIHLAWRALALAWQETDCTEFTPPARGPNYSRLNHHSFGTGTIHPSCYQYGRCIVAPTCAAVDGPCELHRVCDATKAR